MTCDDLQLLFYRSEWMLCCLPSPFGFLFLSGSIFQQMIHNFFTHDICPSVGHSLVSIPNVLVPGKANSTIRGPWKLIPKLLGHGPTGQTTPQQNDEARSPARTLCKDFRPSSTNLLDTRGVPRWASITFADYLATGREAREGGGAKMGPSDEKRKAKQPHPKIPNFLGPGAPWWVPFWGGAQMQTTTMAEPDARALTRFPPPLPT